MSRSGRRIPDRQQLSERAAENEPLIETPILNMLANENRPLLGDIRRNILLRVREEVQERRTVGGLSDRIATTLTQPVTTAIRTEAEQRVQERVQQGVTQVAENMGSEE